MLSSDSLHNATQLNGGEQKKNEENTENGHTPAERSKMAATKAAGKAEVRSGMRLGIGSGTTMRFFIEWLREEHDSKRLTDIQCVATSYQTRNWLMEAKLPVFELDQLNQLDLAVDGADEVDRALNCIKGGGGCLLQEKIVQSCAKRFVLVGGLNKYSETLGQTYHSIPIEVAPVGFAPVRRWITEKHGGECVLRMFKCSPLLTENHNYILDWKFPRPVTADIDWDTISRSISCIPGVAETGLFIGVAQKAYFATPEGQIQCFLPIKKC